MTNHPPEVFHYADPQGEPNARELAAIHFTQWYKHPVAASQILFTVGAANGLSLAFQALTPCTIVCMTPCHTLYHPHVHGQEFYSIPRFPAKGDPPNVETILSHLNKALRLCRKDKRKCVFVLCDPDNPTGTSLSANDKKELALYLKKYASEVTLVLDESYAEINFGTKHQSLFEFCKELPNVIIIRSATKSMSCPGERTALLACFNYELLKKMRNISTGQHGHAPRLLQMPYAESLQELLNHNEEPTPALLGIGKYYEDKVNLVYRYLACMRALVKVGSTEHPKPVGAFYMLADLSDIRYLPQPSKGCPVEDQVSDWLLPTAGLILCPLSKFYPDGKQDDGNRGIFRITCTATIEVLVEIMERIADGLLAAREEKYKLLLKLTNKLCNFLDIRVRKQFKDRVGEITDGHRNPGTPKVSVMENKLSTRLSKIPDEACKQAYAMEHLDSGFAAYPGKQRDINESLASVISEFLYNKPCARIKIFECYPELSAELKHRISAKEERCRSGARGHRKTERNHTWSPSQLKLRLFAPKQRYQRLQDRPVTPTACI